MKHFWQVSEKELRDKAIQAAVEYYRKVCKKEKVFTPGDHIPYSGRVFDESEISCLIDSSLDLRLTAGRYAKEFESIFSKWLGVSHCSLVNSGSSANLLAFMALTSPELHERRIKRGDEIITAATGFPTTIAPIVQYGAVPVFIDVEIPLYNIDCSLLENALSDKTKAVMLAHTLGNPFDLTRVKSFCDKYNLWLIEDNCDALGSRFFLDDKWVYTGTAGDIGTSSFYPPHHITMGEGGAVYTNNTQLKNLIESFRDWGRDCCCPPGCDNTCKNRFNKQYGELPFGYDHKYIYSHFGYNLKLTDIQAAVGCAQLKKLPDFIEARKKNWNTLRKDLENLSDRFILPEPAPGSDPSWFGFVLTVREGTGISREKIVNSLETRGIQTRMLFAGNILKHPCFNEMKKTEGGFRVAGELKSTDTVMNHTFWLGVYPGLSEDMIDFMVTAIYEAAK